MKKTKIICTMGPNTNDRNMMKQLAENGMDIARFNFSHGDHKEQKSRNEKQSEMLACSKGFKTDVMYNQRMLKNMYYSHIQHMQNQMISMNSKSKDKTNNKEKKDEKGFINNSLLYLKHVKSESNNIHKGRKLGLQGITNRSGYQKSLVYKH